MGGWDRALDAAGLDEPRLRDDYGRQREQVARADVPAVLHRSAAPAKPAAARLLVREYLRARRLRR